MSTRNKTKEPQSRGWFCTRSYEYDRQQAAKQGYDLTEDEWRRGIVKLMRALRKSGKFRFLHFIFHDRDPKEDDKGNPVFGADGTFELKGLHVHVLLLCVNAQNRTWMVSQLGLSDRPQNAIRWSRKRDRTHWALYLTHSNQKDRQLGKYEYAISDVDVWFNDQASPEAAESLYRRQRSGYMPEDKFTPVPARARFEEKHLDLVSRGLETPSDVIRLLADPEVVEELELGDSPRYRFEFSSRLEQAQALFMSGLVDYYQKHPRCLTTVYFEGHNGLGKTTLAQAYAWHVIEAVGSGLGIHNVAASGGDKLTFDPAGSYAGQVVSLFNEFSGSVIAPPLFKDMLDPTHAALTNSRNSDKFYAASYALFTADEPLEQQFKELFMSYGRSTVHRGDYEATGQNGRMSEKDWTDLYMRQIRDQIAQYARRMAVYVRLYRVTDSRETGHIDIKGAAWPATTDVIAVICVRDDRHNLAYLDFYGHSRPYSPAGALVPYSLLADDKGRTLWPSFCQDDLSGNESRSLVTFYPEGSRSTYMRSPDAGRYDFVCALPVDPFDDGSVARFCEALDYAVRYYHELNHYEVTPYNTPALPDLEAYAAERVDELKHRKA